MLVAPKNINIISIIDKKGTVGSEPLHGIGDDYCSYYIKNHKTLVPASDLVNEVIGNFLLRAWKINTPEIALITLDPIVLNRDFGNMHKKQYYKRIAFGSKEVDGAFDLTEINTVSGKVDFKKFNAPEQFARIGLFDMWTENEDRPPDLKNIMLYEENERYNFLAIDNAFLFRTGVYNSLSNNEFIPTEQQYCLQSAYFQIFKRYLKGINRNWAKLEEENFYFCINRSKEIFKECVKYLPKSWGFTEKEKNLITNFLFNEERNKSVFTEYLRLLS